MSFSGAWTEIHVAMKLLCLFVNNTINKIYHLILDGSTCCIVLYCSSPSFRFGLCLIKVNKAFGVTLCVDKVETWVCGCPTVTREHTLVGVLRVSPKEHYDDVL